MYLNEYQMKADSTAEYYCKNTVVGIIYNVLQISSEAGEIAGKLAKHIYKNGLDNIRYADQLELEKEIGDLLWHAAQLATELKVTLARIAQINLAKLADRKERNVLHGNGDNR